MISSRLKVISDFINEDVRVIDIGCDHALLDIYLTLNKNIKCVALDVNKNALDIARNNIKKYNLDDKIEIVLSNGVDEIELKDNDYLVMSGMGTKTIIKILRSKKIKNQKLIIQSNTEIFKLRKVLKKLGYHVIDEEVVYEKNKFYPTIFYEKGKEKSNILIGRLLNKKNGYEYVNYLIKKLEIIFNNKPNSFEKFNLYFKLKYLKKSLRDFKEKM